jgi:hypothetical protein
LFAFIPGNCLNIESTFSSLSHADDDIGLMFLNSRLKQLTGFTPDHRNLQIDNLFKTGCGDPGGVGASAIKWGKSSNEYCHRVSIELIVCVKAYLDWV